MIVGLSPLLLFVAPPAARFVAPPATSRLACAPRMDVKQALQVEVGQQMPLAYVEIVTDDCAMEDNCQLTTTEDFFGKGKCVIVGMPGAFTPTCTDAHLPSFIRNAKKFRRLGVEKVAVVTTNDKFIMTAWKKAMRECMQAEGLSSLDTKSLCSLTRTPTLSRPSASHTTWR